MVVVDRGGASGRGEGQGREGAPGWSIRPSWSVAARVESGTREPGTRESGKREADAPRRFDVYYGAERKVWGLRDRSAAVRWIERLSA
ncbi:MAG: hypothetical protein M3442_08385 [Chloroflexota bacterium]|nr:hypothetical protein [Chloroflexota bacterium]